MTLRAMWGWLLGVVVLGAAVGAARAAEVENEAEDEEPPFMAFGDTMDPLTDEQAARALARGGRLLTDPEGAAPGAAAQPAQAAMSPELVAQMAPMYERSIAQMRAQIEKLDPEKDAEVRAQLERVVADTQAMLTQLRSGHMPGAGASGDAASDRKVPAVGDRVPGFDEAIANLKRYLADNAPAEAIALFEASEEAKHPQKAAAAGACTMMMNSPTAALAALLRAHELEPGEPMHLVNLAAAASRLSMPRHALALLERAEAMGTPLGSPLGIPGRAFLLTNRGAALIAIGRPAEAEATLREAVSLAPELAEARAMLAFALHGQDDEEKKAQGVRFLAVARKRATVKTAEQATSPPPAPPREEPPPERPADGQAYTAEQLDRMAERLRRGRPPAREVFDVSRGRSHVLPSLKIPRTVGEAAGMRDAVWKFHEHLQAKQARYVRRMNELHDLMGRRLRSGQTSPASDARARAVFWYISHTYTEREFRAQFATMHRAIHDRGSGSFGGDTGNPFGSLEMKAKQDEVLASSLSFEQTCARMAEIGAEFHGQWQGPIRNLYNEVGLFSQREYRFQTALAANLADPVHHEYAMCLIRSLAIARFMDVLSPVMAVTNWASHYASSWRIPVAAGEEPQDGEYPDAGMCPSHLKGQYKVKVSFKFVELSGNCEKVGMEVSAGEWIKAFGEVERTFEGETSVFVGVAGEVRAPGAVVSPEAAVKSGVFVKWDKNGDLVDFGFKRTEAAGVSLEWNDVGFGYEREQEFEYGRDAIKADIALVTGVAWE